MSSVPLVDLKAQHRRVEAAVLDGFRRVLDSTSFILGREVAELETAFAEFSRVRRCVGVANGTDALELLLRALRIGPGDEVIVPANTFVATPLAIARAGATPVFVDSDPEYHLVDPARVASAIGPRTRAVFAVHLYGQMAPMTALESALAGTDVLLLEDAAQSHGASQEGRPSGGVGVGAGVSFYPGKNLGAYGDAGAVLTGSDAVADTVKALRNYGSDVKYHHPETGFNSRMDTLQAVVLAAKLPILAEGNAARRAAARRYDELLSELPEVVPPRTLPGNEHVWHLYVVRVPRRDAVLKGLAARGIGAGIHYPIPCHLQGAFRYLGHRRGDFPVAEAAADEILSLPMFPEITPGQQQEVVDALGAALAEAGA